VLLAGLALLGTASLAWADDGGCATCGGGVSTSTGNCGSNTHCPPHFVHFMERPPCIKFKCSCPRPVCDPCDLPHFGYYQPCWRPWPFPPDWSHCACPPPSTLVPPPTATTSAGGYNPGVYNPGGSPYNVTPPAKPANPDPDLPSPRRTGKPAVMAN
jgi:hypothetical protein